MANANREDAKMVLRRAREIDICINRNAGQCGGLQMKKNKKRQSGFYLEMVGPMKMMINVCNGHSAMIHNH